MDMRVGKLTVIVAVVVSVLAAHEACREFWGPCSRTDPGLQDGLYKFDQPKADTIGMCQAPNSCPFTTRPKIHICFVCVSKD